MNDPRDRPEKTVRRTDAAALHPAPGWAEFLVGDERVVWLLTGFYVVAGFVFVWTSYTINDEGLLTYYWASWARQAFAPVFFFQKLKPVLTAVYLPFSAGGMRVTLAAHVVIASLAIPMIAATARSVGQRLPNVAATVLTLSPIFFLGGSAGLSNIDGVVGICLVFYLFGARRMPIAAGIVAGLLPWVRFELGMFALVVGVYALLRREERRALAGLVVFPLVYGIAGALYHGDLLWMLHFPPSAPYDPSNPIYREQLIGPLYFLEPAMALTPAAALVVWAPTRRLSPLEKMALAYAVVAAIAVHLFPMLRIGNFGASPRYSIQMLPTLALMIGRVMEPGWQEGRRSLAAVIAMLVAAAWLTTRQTDPIAITAIFGASVAVGAAACAGRGRAAVALVIALVLAGPCLPLRVEIGRPTTAAYLDPIVNWLAAHPREASSPIYTNSQLLAPFLETDGRLATEAITFVAGFDTTREEVFLTNEANGQRARLRQLSRQELYGRTLAGPVRPEDLPEGAILALRVESRLPLLFPDAEWGPRLQILDESPLHRIARLLPAGKSSEQPATSAAPPA